MTVWGQNEVENHGISYCVLISLFSDFTIHYSTNNMIYRLNRLAPNSHFTYTRPSDPSDSFHPADDRFLHMIPIYGAKQCHFLWIWVQERGKRKNRTNSNKQDHTSLALTSKVH